MNGSESRALVVAVDRIVSRLEKVGEYAWLRNPEYRFHFVNEPFAAVYVYLDATGVGQLIVDSVAEWGIKAWILPFYFTHGDRRNQGLEKGDARQGFPRLEAPGAAPEPSSPPHTTEHMGDFVQENRERPGTDRSVLPRAHRFSERRSRPGSKGVCRMHKTRDAWIAAVTLILLFPVKAQAASELGDFSGIIYPGLEVRVPQGQSYTFDQHGIPTNNVGCTLDDISILQLENYYASWLYDDLPQIVTVSTDDPDAIWAMADCMAEIRYWLKDYYTYFDKVIIDATYLFIELIPNGAATGDLHPSYQQRAAAWYDRVLASVDPGDPFRDTLFSPSEAWFVPIQEIHAFSNGEVNDAVRFGTGLWTDGPNWKTMPTVVAAGIHSLTFPRFNNVFPWRIDYIVGGSYGTYNPNDPNHPFNDGEFHALLDTWLDHVHPHQQAILNVRSYRHLTGPNSMWADGTTIKANHIRWTQQAWCHWARQHPEIGFAATVLWTWRSSPAEGGIQALDELFQEVTMDNNGNGMNDLVDQTFRYFEITGASESSCWL